MQPNFAHEHEACILICSSIRYPRGRIVWNIFGVPRTLEILYRSLYTTTSSCLECVIFFLFDGKSWKWSGGWSMSYYHDIGGLIVFGVYGTCLICTGYMKCTWLIEIKSFSWIISSFVCACICAWTMAGNRKERDKLVTVRKIQYRRDGTPGEGLDRSGRSRRCLKRAWGVSANEQAHARR